MPLRGPGGGSGSWVPLFVAAPPSEPLTASINLIEPTPRRGSRFDTDELLRCGYYSADAASDLSSPRSSTGGSSSAGSPVLRRPSQMDFGLLAPTMIPIRMAPPSPPPLMEPRESRPPSRGGRHSPALEAVAGFVSLTMQRTASATSTAFGGGCTGHARRRSSVGYAHEKQFALVDFGGGAEAAAAARAEEEEEARNAATLKLLGVLVLCGMLIPVVGQWVP